MVDEGKSVEQEFQAAQTALSDRLEEAAALANDVNSLLPVREFRRSVDRAIEDYPSLTLRRLEMAARVQYGAGIQLLKNPWTAYAVESHARGLMEVMAHVGWITGRAETDTSSPRCRALRLERGIAHALHVNLAGMRAVAPGHVHPTEPAAETTRREMLDRLWREANCKGRIRLPGNVQTSIRAIQDSNRLPTWFDTMFDLLSRAVHQQALDRMMREGPDGVTFAATTFSQRGWSLTWLLIMYGHVLAWTIVAEGSERNGGDVIARVQAMIDHPWMEEARNGRVDELIGYPPIGS